MDALDAISNRIEQLETKMGMSAVENDQRGDTIAANLATAAQCMFAATAGHEKLAAAYQRANELNNYTDPRYIERMQESEARAAAVISAAPTLQHHCHCMHQCHRSAPVLSSEALQTAASLEPDLQRVRDQAMYDQQVVDEVSHGISNVVTQCGEAASVANESVAAVAKKLDGSTSVRSLMMDDNVSVKSFASAKSHISSTELEPPKPQPKPLAVTKRRNGLD